MSSTNNSKKYLIEDKDNKINAVIHLRKKRKVVTNDLHNDDLIVSSSPHTFSSTTTTKIMLDVIIALIPASIAAILIFGFRALGLILVCVGASVFFEWGFQKICKKKNTISDLSAIVTGLLLALNLPASVPWWQAIIGCLVAIVVVKGLFGGIGKNFANPAITARVVMLLAFSGTVGAIFNPTIIDVTSTATPLATLKNIFRIDYGLYPPLWQMLLGIKGGAIGETCVIALLIGGIYLIVKKVITWHTPVVYIGTVFILCLLFSKFDFTFALYEILSGGLFIGAFFMATDYATTPSRPLGKIIFAVGCGIITTVIRLWGNYPEGVSFSILFMNILTPFIDTLTRRKPFGGLKYEK